LSLQLRTGEDVSGLCEGIAAARSLTSFDLTVDDGLKSRSSFQEILESVQNHPGMRKFVFVVEISPPSWIDLESILAKHEPRSF
jgi:hypothetical protein